MPFAVFSAALLAVVSAALSQKKAMFRSGGFLNRLLMGYFGHKGRCEVTKAGGENYVMRSPLNFAFRLI